MSVSRITLVSSLIISYVCTQEYFEDLHMAHYAPKFSKIPKKFEIRSNTAHNEFEKFANEISHIAKRDNSTITYKINVEVLKPNKKKYMKKFLKKGWSKKYNVPLKKNSMKLSNFETFLRKMSDTSNHKTQKFEFHKLSSTHSPEIVTLKQIMMKYKPVPSTLYNYAKVIKPVRKTLITLT